MSQQILLKQGAKNDLQEAYDWYFQIENALAEPFLIQVDQAFDYHRNNPLAFQERYRNVRIVFLKKFPYGVHFTFENNTLFVHAVFHFSLVPKDE